MARSITDEQAIAKRNLNVNYALPIEVRVLFADIKAHKTRTMYYVLYSCRNRTYAGAQR